MIILCAFLKKFLFKKSEEILIYSKSLNMPKIIGKYSILSLKKSFKNTTKTLRNFSLRLYLIQRKLRRPMKVHLKT